jgi:4-diphosphocytidyl-2-C-methyl-D-erythritol kinase
VENAALSQPHTDVWPAPAKINLFLHVLGRRPDDYHDIQTAFQFLDYCDDITIALRRDGQIRRHGGLADLPAQNDLAVRAAVALKRHGGVSVGADLTIAKRIPVGGGLGGGSSDAATTLVALNRLWGLALPTSALCQLGRALGADVPVFVQGLACWAEGVGDRLTPLSGDLAPPESAYLVVRPGIAVSTASIFQAPELTRNSAPITIRGFFATGGRNDCEATVRRRFPPVARAFDWLSQWGVPRLTGTGACVFLACANIEEAQAIGAKLPPEFFGFAARGRNRSPLLDRLVIR